MGEDARAKLWERGPAVAGQMEQRLWLLAGPGHGLFKLSAQSGVASHSSEQALSRLSSYRLPWCKSKPAGLLEQFSRLSSLGRGSCFRAQLMHYASGLPATDSPSANVDLKSNGVIKPTHLNVQTHTQRNLLIQKLYYFLRLSQKSSGKKLE